MKPLRIVYWLASALMISATAVAAAQDASCPTIVRTALAATDEACAGTGRNEACYGNINLEAQPQPGVSDFTFTAPGDLVSVAGIQTLTLKPLDLQTDVWGVALMKLQANLPDTLPGQNVTFLLFGDVEIQNAVSSNVEGGGESAGGVTLAVTVSMMVPLIESFDGSSTAMPKMLNAGTTATADGYFAMADMIHVVLEDESQGYLPASMVQVNGDVNTLPAIDPTGMLSQTDVEAAPLLAPMQAFYFKSGVDDAPCEEAPDSGILIQTPEGAGKIDLVVNDAKVTLGSTGYFQAQPGDEMTIAVVEGEGTVESAGRMVTIPAGTLARVPVDDNLRASGAPSDPEPYDPADLSALPVKILPQTIAIAPAFEVTPVVEAVDTITVQPGEWTATTGEPTLGAGCPAEIAQGFATGAASISGQTNTFTMPEGGFDLESIMIANNSEMPGETTYSHPEPNLYVMDLEIEGTVTHYEFRLISPTQIDGEYSFSVEGCEFGYTSTLEFAG